MIPVKFKSLDSVDVLYDEMIKNISKKNAAMMDNIDQWCRKELDRSLEYIIKADYEELENIRARYDNLPAGTIPPESDPRYNTYKKFMIETLYKRKFPRKRFVEELQVTVCPYCNRNFVNSTYKRTMCDLEHFFDKAKYPIFAVSFYNLIPVCHPCNHVKASGKISYSPHNPRYTTDELLTFDYFITGTDFLRDAQQIGIEIDYDQAKFGKNVQVLKLNEVYQIHTDLVQECIKKATIFNKEYLQGLYRTYPELFESEEELYRIVFGNYEKEEDYGKRPLSKLTKDIIQELWEYSG